MREMQEGWHCNVLTAQSWWVDGWCKQGKVCNESQYRTTRSITAHSVVLENKMMTGYNCQHRLTKREIVYSTLAHSVRPQDASMHTQTNGTLCTLLAPVSSVPSHSCRKVACQPLLNSINLPVTSRVRSKLEALGQLGPVATSGGAMRRRKRTRAAQHPCRSTISYFNRHDTLFLTGPKIELFESPTLQD